MNTKGDLGRTDREQVQYLDCGKLRAGDIMLCTDPDSAKSYIIRKATGSPYSHAAICLEPGEFLEAIGMGVHRFSALMAAVGNPANVCFLRVHPGNERIAAKAARKAEHYIARHYWTSGALMALSEKVALEDKGAFFCSHLVAQAYHEAGLELLADLPPDKVVPGALVMSPALHNVTGEILLPPQIPERWRPARLLDGPTSPAIHDAEIRVRQALNPRIRQLFREHELSEPADLNAAVQALLTVENDETMAAIDRGLVAALQETNYLDLPKIDSLKLAAMLRLGDTIAHGIQQGMDTDTMVKVLEYSRNQHQALRARISHDEIVIRGFQGGHAKTGCETFAVLARVQAEMHEIFVRAEQSLGHGIHLLETTIQ
jgi:hypothetical protein